MLVEFIIFYPPYQPGESPPANLGGITKRSIMKKKNLLLILAIVAVCIVIIGCAFTPTASTKPNLIDKTITENGTYTADGADGFSSITVNVPQVAPGEIISTPHASTNTIEHTALDQEWADKEKFTVFTPVNCPAVSITVNGTTNTGKYYVSNHSLRVYSSEGGSITISSTQEDFHIIAISIDYDTGTLVDGLSVAVLSDEIISVTDDTITLSCSEGIANIYSISIIGYYN